MTYQARALAENSGVVPNTHVAPHNLQLQFQGIRRPLRVSMGTECMWCKVVL